MSSAPAEPKIYHITHLDNLQGVIDHGCLWSDAERLERGLECKVVGMREVKRRRLEELEVRCHPGTRVGANVPFNFCPRSVMLFLLHRGNHPEVTYTGGQEGLVHLQADLRSSVSWAESNRCRWAFTNRNAGAYLTQFSSSLADLENVDWAAVEARDFREAKVKENKQAEFLMYGSFPLQLVERIGVHRRAAQRVVEGLLQRAEHRPPVAVEPSWYF